MPKISIAMATYCGERYVEKQLKSLLNQTRRPDEVLIFDDRSSDNTVQIVNDFIEKNKLENWSITVNETNLGFVKNFYKAMKTCSGDIIFMCDQDDIWHDNKLEVMEKLFEQYPDAAAVNTGFGLIDGEDKPFSDAKKCGTTNHGLIPKTLDKRSLTAISCGELFDNISPGCTMAITKNLKDFYLENSTLKIPHDHELNIYAAKIGKLYFYNDELISYRIHSSNALGLNTKKRTLKDRITVNLGKRLKGIEVQFETARILQDALKDTPDFEIGLKFYRFATLRRELLIDKRLSSWFKMAFAFRHLKPFTTPSQLIGDLYQRFHI